MQNAFRIWETNRNLHAKLLDNYTLEQLNTTPPGFTNNLAWNLGHIIAAQQGLVYRLSGLPMNISMELYETYRNGSKPTGITTQAEIEALREMLFSHIEMTKTDFANGKFTTFDAYTTQTGFHLASLEESIIFNNYHEGLHLGFMMNIRKFI